MPILKLKSEQAVFSSHDLNEFFKTRKLTEEHFEDINRLKKWIKKNKSGIYYIMEIEAAYDLPGYLITEYDYG